MHVGYYLSGNGWVSCSWRVGDGKFLMTVEVPKGSDATVVLPYADENGKKVFSLKAGKYKFTTMIKK